MKAQLIPLRQLVPMALLKSKVAIKEDRPHMKVNLKTTNEAENAAETPNYHQRGQRTVNGIIGNTRRGIVIDKTLDPNSNNPVSNKPVSTALAALAGQLEKGQVVFLDQLPESGEPHKVYVLTATNQRYWWDGSAFVKIVPSATGGGSGESIPVVEGTITSENTFALNETPTGDYFLAHLLYAGFVYVNSLMTKTTVTFGETNLIFYIGLIVLNGVPFLAYSAASEDGNSVNNVMKQICFMNNPYQSNGIIYFTNGGFDSLEYGASGTYLKSTGDGVVWDTPSTGSSGSVTITFED